MTWTYEWDNDVGPDDEYYIEFFSVYDGEHNKIGQFDEEDDARLASAAPDLLDSIKGLLECMESAIESGDWKVDGACDPDLAVQRSGMAIAKALGKSWIPRN